MFNFCAVSGVVCGGLNLYGVGDADNFITFKLGIRTVIDPAGKIEVICLNRLALVAAKYLRQGDRVAVVGFLIMNERQNEAGEWHNDAELIAMDLELVKEGEHTQG